MKVFAVSWHTKIHTHSRCHSVIALTLELRFKYTHCICIVNNFHGFYYCHFIFFFWVCSSNADGCLLSSAAFWMENVTSESHLKRKEEEGKKSASNSNCMLEKNTSNTHKASHKLHTICTQKDLRFSRPRQKVFKHLKHVSASTSFCIFSFEIVIVAVFLCIACITCSILTHILNVTYILL